MRATLENLIGALRAAIAYRGGPSDPTVRLSAATTLVRSVQLNLDNCSDSVYADTVVGRIDADALIETIQALMPAGIN